MKTYPSYNATALLALAVFLFSSPLYAAEIEFPIYRYQGVLTKPVLQKKLECMKALGDAHQLKCECIAVKMPAEISVSDYLSIISATDEISNKDKKMVDSVKKVRNQCPL